MKSPRFIFLLLVGFLPIQSFHAQAEFDFFEASITELQQAMAEGSLNSVDLVEHYLARINAYDQQGPTLNSIIRVNPDASELAAQLDSERQSSGARSLLHGIPIVVKDNYNTAFMPTTGGSVALANFRPAKNATQIQKLIDAGAIVIAKTSLHEFAYGITTIGSLFGQTRNPYDIRRVPGGSSGGTGAAVAANFAAFGLGSDTCGSIRIPSAFNNLVGLRPSKGLSSIYGVMPLAHTQDVAGPLAKNVEDLAIVLDIVKGYDLNDSATEVTRNAAIPEFVAALQDVDISTLRIGRLDDYFSNADAVVRNTIDSALEWYEEQGAEIVSVEIPELRSLLASSGVLALEFRVDLDAYLSEFGSDEIDSLADIVDNGLYHQAVRGPLARDRGRVRDETAYAAGLAARNVLRTRLEEFMMDNELDAIVYPTIGRTAVRTGDSQQGSNCSLSANSGLPALAIPAGFTAAGLPVGMEMLGSFFADAQLLAIARPYEVARETRQAPASVPPLIDGRPPAAINLRLDFDSAGVQIHSDFNFDLLSNTLRYQIAVSEESRGEIFAVTLVIEDENQQGDDTITPVVLNLLGPEQSSRQGEYFMSAQFREAFAARKVSMKVFAEPLPRTGTIWPLR